MLARTLALALGAGLALAALASRPEDPLPSWTDGPTKKALLDFVAR